MSGCGASHTPPAYVTGTQGVTTYGLVTEAITADCSVSATFAINQYNVSASTGSGGSLSGSTPSPVIKNYGETATFTFNADSGYHISGISGCGGSFTPPAYVAGTSGVTTHDLTTGAIAADCSVSATFAINQYTVSASAGAGGSLSEGTPSPAIKNYGETETFTFNANTGYHISGVSGCGASFTPPAYVTGTQGVTTYDLTTGAITSDCAVSASFAVNQYTVVATGGLNGSDGIGGTVAPSSQVINHGLSAAISITVGSGFSAAGSGSTCGGNLSGSGSNYTFTTSGVTGDCVVTIDFDDIRLPTLSNLILPASSSSLEVALININASDNDRVSGYYVSENSTLPANPQWVGTKPTSFTVDTEGRHTLYAWVRDPSGNVSARVSDSVIVTLPQAIELAETGQRSCYDGSGPVACPGTGQDGEWRTGAPWPDPRFVDNGDGSFTDLLTGNMNPQDANLLVNRNPLWDGSIDGRLTWQQALDYIKKLNAEFYLGYNDWRLPNVTELASLHSFQTTFVAYVTGEDFVNAQSGLYWTSTTDMSDTTLALTIGNNGAVSSLGKALTAFVFPVRNDLPLTGAVQLLQTGQSACYDTAGIEIPCVDPLTGEHTGQDGDVQAGIPWLAPRFEAETEEMIVDQSTGLLWTADADGPGPEPCGPGAAKTWAEAHDYIACLNQERYLGFPDWRLPNVVELMSIMNHQEEDSTEWLEDEGFRNAAARLLDLGLR